MFYYVAKTDVVAASGDSIEICTFREAGVLDLIGVFVG